MYVMSRFYLFIYLFIFIYLFVNTDTQVTNTSSRQQNYAGSVWNALYRV